MQTILGAGGVIGLELARILHEYTDSVRLVGRRPKKVVDSDETFVADLLNADDVMRALEGSRVAYLVAGLPYDAKTWRAQWPVVMKNTIDACRANGCRLVFFDNIYMYDRDALGRMDENTPVRPTSRKGEVRAEIVDTFTRAVESGSIDGLVARSADFYGPGRQKTSVLTRTVFDRLAAGKPAQWLLSLDSRHSFTFTPDAGRATAILGNTDDAYGDVWHLPTAADPMTGREWIEAIAAEFGVEPKIQVAGNTLLTLMGLIVPEMRELKEMAYQYDRDYVFLSDKFEKRFAFEPTPYREGIKRIVESDYR